MSEVEGGGGVMVKPGSFAPKIFASEKESLLVPTNLVVTV